MDRDKWRVRRVRIPYGLGGSRRGWAWGVFAPGVDLLVWKACVIHADAFRVAEREAHRERADRWRNQDWDRL